MRQLLRALPVVVPICLSACGGGGDDATPSAGGGTGGISAAGNAGQTAAGKAGATSAGAGGATAAGMGGTTSAGAGGATAAGTGGTTTAGAGGTTSAGTGGSVSGGSSGATSAGTGGTVSGGSSGATSAGAGGASAGSGGSPPATGIFAAPQTPHTFTYRIAKPYTTTETSTYDVIGLDLFDNTKETVQALKAKGKTVICYFSSTYEDWRPDFTALTSAADKAALADLQAGPLDSWPGEQWVDIHGFTATSGSAAHKLLRNIMSGRIQQAKDKGCDAVDFDNVNEHENMVKNKSGQSISALDQLAYNTWLAEEAHKSGMKAFLKNDLSQIADDASYPGGKGLAKIFDGAINEQCFEFTECDQMIPFRDLQKPIFVIQYKYGATFPTAAHMTEAKTLHLNVSYYAKDSATALQFDPSQTFGSW